MSAVPNNIAHDIPPQVARRAVEWLVELQSDDSCDKSRRALDVWLKQHPDHMRAWQRIESVNNNLRYMASPLGSAVAHATLTTPRSASRREAIKILSALFFVSGTAWLAEEQIPWQAWTADERTAVGERRKVTLSDGTQITLNTDTAINVRFSANERRVMLVNGEIMVTTGRDDGVAHRPFLLQTVQGELRPIGTRFSVRQQTNVSRLDVFEGAVEIRPRAGAGLTRILQAGERASFTYNGIGTIAAASETDSAWTEDMIVASGMRLQDFIAELSRHRRGRLTCDPAIADLRVSGTYPLNDSDLIIDALRSSLPIEAHFMTRYWVTLRVKEAT